MTQPPEVRQNDPKFKEVSKRIDEWLPLHQGERFDLDLVCRQNSLDTAVTRNHASRKLAYEVKKGLLEKDGRYYRYIDNTLVPVEWIDKKDSPVLDIQWPRGHESENQGWTDSRFGFDGHCVITAGSLIVLAGVTNTGKTTFSRNFLLANMDYMPCTLFVNENIQGEEFNESINKMTWANPFKEDGTSKFEVFERWENHKDVIRPDGINIIDWLMVSDNFFLIGQMLEGIKKKLRKGIALVAIQKDPMKDAGVGGMFGEHLATLYLAMNFGRVLVKKCKKPSSGYNPNFKWYGFDIVNEGTQFHKIREVKKCSRCYGSGKKGGSKCPVCLGSGYIDARAGEPDDENVWGMPQPPENETVV